MTLTDEKLLQQHLRLGADDDLSVVKTKKLEINKTIYTVAYTAFMREKKADPKYRLTADDQFNILWSALFCLAFQVFFIHSLVYITGVPFQLHNNTSIQLCLVFTTMLLHFTCIPATRSGVYMMKFVLAHPEKFTHPRIAFMLGFIQFITQVIAEAVNIMKSTTRTKPLDLISGYLGFATIIKVPEIYLAVVDTPVKGGVGPLMMTTGRK